MSHVDGAGNPGPTDDFSIGWRDPELLRVLCRVAGEKGFLGGVDVLPLATGLADREYLLTVDLGEGLVLASARFTWSEVKPPDSMNGIEAARHVIDCVDQVARRAEAGLKAYTWLRVASELEQVRMLLERDGGA